MKKSMMLTILVATLTAPIAQASPATESNLSPSKPISATVLKERIQKNETEINRLKNKNAQEQNEIHRIQKEKELIELQIKSKTPVLIPTTPDVHGDKRAVSPS